MSTKSTIASGATFHLYTELLDDDFVFLALEGHPFEATCNRVVVSIPIAVWEYLRQFAAVDLSWADKDDGALARAVESAVDERIARFAAEGGGSALRLAGVAVYGAPDGPRDAQIASGVAYYTRLRERQRAVIAAIKELRRASHAGAGGGGGGAAVEERGGDADPLEASR
jgi:hypothetical protein